jgi:hypothetical protein
MFGTPWRALNAMEFDNPADRLAVLFPWQFESVPKVNPRFICSFRVTFLSSLDLIRMI